MTENKDDPVMFRFFNEIGIIDQLLRAKLESVLPSGLKMSHFILLNHLVRLGGSWSPVRLANAFQVTKAAITNTLKRLEADGLVKIVGDPTDGRGKQVSITRAGRNKREACIAEIQPFLLALEARFGVQTFAEALPMLEQLRNYLDENR